MKRVRLGNLELVVVATNSAIEGKHLDLPPGLQDVLRGIISGLSNAEIARRRKVSPRTVANQVATLLRLYSADSRADLASKVEAGASPSTSWGARWA